MNANRKNSRRLKLPVTGIVTVTMLGMVRPTHAINYVAEYMTSWSGCACSQNSLSYPDDQIYYFDAKMRALGHTRKYLYSNKNVWTSDITEDRGFNGLDRIYGDTATMYIFSGHGGAPNDSNGQYFSVPFCKGLNGATSGSNGSCLASSRKMRMGEPSTDYYGTPYRGYAAYIMWLTCYSVHTNPMQQWSQTMGVGTDYIMGYKNTSADSSYTDEVGEDWAAKAMGSGAYTFKSSWFYAVDDWWVNDTGGVVANGNTASDATYRRDNYYRYSPATHPDYHGYYTWSWYEG